MKYLSFAVTYAPEDGVNKQNYFLNGLIKEDTSELESAEFCKSSRGRNLFAVVDGSSGEGRGDAVAFLCMDALKYSLGADFDAIHEDYFSVIDEIIKGRIFEEKVKNVRANISVLYTEGGYVRSYNIGDVSTLYYDGASVKELSGVVPKNVTVEEAVEKDDGLVIENVDKKTLPYLGYMSGKRIAAPHISERIKAKRNDIFVIASNSLLQTLTQKQLRELLSNNELSFDEKAEGLIDAAVAAKPDGNYTVQVVEVKDWRSFAGVKLNRWLWGLVAALCIAAVVIFGSEIGSTFKAFGNGLNSIIHGNVKKTENTLESGEPAENSEPSDEEQLELEKPNEEAAPESEVEQEKSDETVSTASVQETQKASSVDIEPSKEQPQAVSEKTNTVSAETAEKTEDTVNTELEATEEGAVDIGISDVTEGEPDIVDGAAEKAETIEGDALTEGV